MGERLKDRVAIVMGAGQTPGETIGNGRAAAILYAREGAKVLLADNRLDAARETLAIVEQEGGAGVAIEADVTSEEDCQRMTESCLERWGRIDILHNNVGIGERGDGFVSMPVDEWKRFLDINLTGMYITCRQVIPHMLKQGSGVITNISSVAAVISTGAAAYKTSKAGVNALTHSLALEAAPYGVRVNAIMPGLMETPMAIEGRMRSYGQAREEVTAPRNERVPLKGGMGTGWDVGQAALFLASDEAKFITGVLLPVDGGQAAKIG